MNVRCFRCGWSNSLSRETLEAAAVSSAGQKTHVIHCPRCRQAIHVPMDQIMRDLPPGWAPPTQTAEPAAASSAPGAEPAARPAEATNTAPAEPAAADEPAPRRSERRHRHAGKANTGDSAAVAAAKKSTHPT